ncbi:class I SAM-dependent methyltransferase [Roseobacter sp.]|uniref:class I SAM-dependent methyltransferase n=1 Tax=Roseobacter sp. TaxID=1907202 RepID=UPI00385819C5
MRRENEEQAEFWTKAAGEKWVEQQVQLDAFMQPVLDSLFTRCDLKNGDHVLDIGCGTGASTIQAANTVGATGSVFGVDISPTMLACAKERAHSLENVRFEVADAADYGFRLGEFDHLISRFGVMFFADPIAAFSNIFKSLKPGAHLTMACWGQISKNPWFTVAAQAAKERLGAPPSVDPDAPGPFAFRDVDRVVQILSSAGFVEIQADVSDVFLEPAGTPSEVAQMATSVGPAARTVEIFQGNFADSQAIANRVQEVFQSFDTQSGVRVPAEINFFQATRSTS